MSKKLKKSTIEVGAQNCHENDDYGPFTGSLNSKMLKSVGAKYIIIGHSENRQAGENNLLINLKIKSALKNGLKVIFCIGETLKERRKKITKQVLIKQIKIGLRQVRNKKNILIAYEPVWSIGTGLIPKSYELFDTINFIKKKNKNLKVLYGGSVSLKNIIELNSVTNIDGFLIGGASQDPKKFIDIIKKTYN
jgi:triosephosphate isomerase